MPRALVPVDGSDNALCAVRHVIKLARGPAPDGDALDVHLLNVQAPFHGDVTAFVAKGSLKDFHREQAEKAMAVACALLDEAGIPYAKHIVVGHPARAIADFAKQIHCDTVIMGTHGYGTVTRLLLGSVSHEAIHQMDPRIPVTLVKSGYPPSLNSRG